MTTGGPKKSQLRSGWCHLSCRRRWQPQAAPGWLASSPRVGGGGLPHGDGSWPVLSPPNDLTRRAATCRPAPGKPMTQNKGVTKDGAQTQRAAAMAAFQSQGKDV